MGSTHPVRGRVTATKFTGVDAARIALTQPPVRLTPARIDVMRVASALWCRTLQFPTLRSIATTSGRCSASSIVTGFGRAVDIQAAVIRAEWEVVDGGWLSSPPSARARWLEEHRRDLLAIDPACLRLPGLVCSSVVSTGLLPGRLLPDLLAPLHGLAAYVDSPVRPSSDGADQHRPHTAADLSLVQPRQVPA